MKALARAFWLVVQAAWGCCLLPWLALTRRGRPLVLTHHGDRDAQGRDRQLGPLLDALGSRYVEVALVPGTAAASFARLRPGAPACVPYALLAVLGRLVRPFARDRSARLAGRAVVARWLLRSLRPRVVLLVDESGSGQPLVRAARALGIRSVGIQHGDFAPGNPQYDRTVSGEVAPADVLCVWSEWFRARLLAVSAVYTRANTDVTGRLRDPAPAAKARAGGALRVLVVAEAHPRFPAEFEPYLAALRADGALAVTVQPHPATAVPARDLAASLAWCDVAVGMRSSALLEATWHGRPVVVAGPDAARHALVTASVAIGCASPAGLSAACREAAADALRPRRAREFVWGSPPADSVRAVLAAGGM